MTASFVRRSCLLGLMLASPGAWALPTLPLLFADGAVVQRDQPMPVWGWAAPNAAITVGFDGKRASAKADATGQWKVSLPAHNAGGPYVLSVQGDGGQLQVRDVLVGDVWLASGQSNMEFALAQASDGPQAVAAANDPQLRHFKVPKSWSVQPQAGLTGGDWKAATPENAGEFTAVGYFFAKELRASTGVPIGIINSTWGGSSIEAWMDAASQSLTADQNQGAIKASKQRDAAAQAATDKRIARWPKVEGDTPQWREAYFDDSDWDSIPVTQQWESSGYKGMDGIAWYRTTVTLSPAEAKAGIALGVGQIDESDITYVNGTQVGETVKQWNLPRVYSVPASALHAGVNHIAVRVEDLNGGGGMHGPDAQRFVRSKADAKRALGGWKFRPAAVRVSFADNQNQLPTLLYNQMIHPLQPFPVKGVIWYQGETNASDTGAVKYREQFAAMIQQWRGERGAKTLPFLWVQLANFKAGGDKGELSPWALLRESQSKTLALPATGQAVIIDIGNPTDIHPTNKRDVGHRLALAARHVAYGETLVYSAPVFKRASFADGQAVLSLDLQGSALQVRGGGAAQGLRIAGADQHFYPATAQIDGDRVIVRSDAARAPVAVRYGWSENPDDANLVNRQNLPVSPFRTDTW
ncbi:sialate O-acetylesterase [Xanthomonas fragariae]|uniref:Glycosyl hydrolases family 2, sugar binding domain n=2 Tax=Xanthomonas fragariae TaxID=48664 RepID=A0A1Y6HP08_9XANT|nr:sialate O-acetylesterase [Xanthomonas fragariae]AOD15157.1 9-O-acetylesterase [Xanthomonas fragariae]AOD18557.1 9-O-acetylesterase [Xanthomonas fragariae]ENZ93889.1 sialate O-acetylesterase [Xanthomonas fragariae LMG 25863]MBL9198476.1 beta galactosidase jelly roll domain-containing protein [Xanthomonas fragariae]MBL9222980.1 beta galactosidase jelly roll domain-containing protein [Xanthomonas fragariae]